jgi:hypothetical protein
MPDGRPVTIVGQIFDRGDHDHERPPRPDRPPIPLPPEGQGPAQIQPWPVGAGGPGAIFPPLPAEQHAPGEYPCHGRLPSSSTFLQKIPDQSYGLHVPDHVSRRQVAGGPLFYAASICR